MFWSIHVYAIYEYCSVFWLHMQISKLSWSDKAVSQSFCLISNYVNSMTLHSSPTKQRKLCTFPLKFCCDEIRNTCCHGVAWHLNAVVCTNKIHSSQQRMVVNPYNPSIVHGWQGSVESISTNQPVSLLNPFPLKQEIQRYCSLEQIRFQDMEFIIIQKH